MNRPLMDSNEPNTDLLMSEKVGLKQKRSPASLTLEVPVTMMHIALVKQIALLTCELRRTL